MNTITSGFNRTLLSSLLLVLVCPPIWANCLAPGQLVGVNLAGAEFNPSALPGRVNQNYVYPVKADLEYFKAAGMNVIRLPFLWERIQPALNGALDSAQVDMIKQVGAWASQLGLCIVLDVHNYGSYRGNAIGSTGAPYNALADLWVRLHGEFPQPEVYAYGLMNEPFHVGVKTWTSVAQSTVLALRNAGSRNLILVGTARWSGAHEFLKEIDGTSADREFGPFNDPLNRFAIELHQYADSDYSGRGRDCMEPATFRQILDRVAEWTRKSGHKMFLGEFGVSGDARCLATLNEALNSMRDASAWKGWTYWAAGRWWGDYAYSVQPKNGVDATQMGVLKRHAKRPVPPSDLSVEAPARP